MHSLPKIITGERPRIVHRFYNRLERLERLERLANPRKKAQEKRQKLMIERRKETRRQLRRQDKEAKAAPRIEAEGNVSDTLGKAIGSRKKRQDAPAAQEEGGHPLIAVKSEGRFVRAVGAIKALRARAFRGKGEGGGESGGIFTTGLVGRDKKKVPSGP